MNSVDRLEAAVRLEIVVPVVACIWAAVLLLTISLCRAAKRGDDAMRALLASSQPAGGDDETGRRIKRLWSFRDSSTGRRAYADICDMSPESRKQLIQKYAYFQDQLRSVRRAMSDSCLESYHDNKAQ